MVNLDERRFLTLPARRRRRTAGKKPRSSILLDVCSTLPVLNRSKRMLSLKDCGQKDDHGTLFILLNRNSCIRASKTSGWMDVGNEQPVLAGTVRVRVHRQYWKERTEGHRTRRNHRRVP